MRRLAALLLAFGLLLSSLPRTLAADEPVLPARAYLLMDASSGRVLYQHEGTAQLPIASTTKIMTAILALEKGNLQDVVTAGQKPYDTGGSTMYLEVGEQLTLQNLLYALMLESANDAAVAIAEHIGGTEEQFVAWMNEKAKAIGAEHTHFVNSHGLHDPNHYSTAYDLALIARYAMQNPEFRRIVTVEEIEIPGYKDSPPRKLWNHNRLLGYYEGITGVKNGYTEEALLTNVAAAKRGDTDLIAVVLGAQDQVWTSSMALLDYGFSHFSGQTLVKKGDSFGDRPVGGTMPARAVAAADVSAALPQGAAQPDRQVEWDAGVKAPIPAGAKLGQVRWLSGDTVLGTVDLVAEAAVAAPAQPTMAALTADTGARKTAYLTWGALGGAAVVIWAMRRSRRRRL